jgi:hypothetical protein
MFTISVDTGVHTIGFVDVCAGDCSAHPERLAMIVNTRKPLKMPDLLCLKDKSLAILPTFLEINKIQGTKYRLIRKT